MKVIVLSAMAVAMATSGAWAQQATAPATGCSSQFEDVPGSSAASLLTAGYKMAAAVPGGIWMQKDSSTVYCNVSRAREGDVLCSKLRPPVQAPSCQ